MKTVAQSLRYDFYFIPASLFAKGLGEKSASNHKAKSPSWIAEKPVLKDWKKRQQRSDSRKFRVTRKAYHENCVQRFGYDSVA